MNMEFNIAGLNKPKKSLSYRCWRHTYVKCKASGILLHDELFYSVGYTCKVYEGGWWGGGVLMYVCLFIHLYTLQIEYFTTLLYPYIDIFFSHFGKSDV